MKRLIYDLETNGLLPDPNKPDAAVVSQIHCLVTLDADSEEVLAYWDTDPVGATACGVPRAGSIDDGVRSILAADLRIGQNIVLYDEAVLRRLRPNAVPAVTDHPRIRDTTIGARVVWPDENLALKDYLRRGQGGNDLPKELEGSHSLEAWGYRLGVRKGDFGKQNGWAEFTKPMLLYCIQDCRVTLALYRLLEKKQKEGRLPRRAWLLEQEFAEIIQGQYLHGFPFDMSGAEALTAKLTKRQLEIHEQLVALVPPKTITTVSPVRKILKTKIVPFNPGSLIQIGEYLVSQGYKPDKKTGYTPSGRVKVDETTLDGVTKRFPGVDELKEYLMLGKRLGQLATGKAAWMTLARKGVDGIYRIHGKVKHNAAGTHRSTHNSPNVSAVPKAGNNKDGTPISPYGSECRALFTVAPLGPKWRLVGGDASGIELRGLAHYMAQYDGGEYITLVTTGDPHGRNQAAAGLASRDMAKTFLYALLYGAQDTKLGKIAGGKKALGTEKRAAFEKGLPAFKKLKDAVTETAGQLGRLEGLDGRWGEVRSQHSTLNLLLQMFGAVIMKLATVLFHRKCREAGLVIGVDYFQVQFSHDEIQCAVQEQHATQVGTLIVEAIREAGQKLEVKCPLAGEWKVGITWADTH